MMQTANDFPVFFFVIHVLLIHHDNMHGIKSDALKRRQNLLEGAEHFG